MGDLGLHKSDFLMALMKEDGSIIAGNSLTLAATGPTCVDFCLNWLMKTVRKHEKNNIQALLLDRGMSFYLFMF
jgi:hypothetical protein